MSSNWPSAQYQFVSHYIPMTPDHAEHPDRLFVYDSIGGGGNSNVIIITITLHNITLLCNVIVYTEVHKKRGSLHLTITLASLN